MSPEPGRRPRCRSADPPVCPGLHPVEMLTGKVPLITLTSSTNILMQIRAPWSLAAQGLPRLKILESILTLVLHDG